MVSVNTIQAFNKAGSRLLQKITKTPIENQVFVMGNTTFSAGPKVFHGVTPPKMAVTGSFVEGEKAFGKDGFQIVSFFDDKGKLIQRHRFSVLPTKGKPTLSSVTDYSSMITGKESNLTTGESFSTHKKSYDVNENLISDKSTELQLAYNKLTGTKGTMAVSTLNKNAGIIFTEAGRDVNNLATKHMADRFDINLKEVGQIANKKSYNRSVFYEPSTGTYHSFQGKGTNLSAEEMSVLNSDRYLPIQLHKKINPYEYIVKDAFSAQHIPLNTRTEYVNPAPGHRPAGRVYRNTNHIEFDLGSGVRSSINVANHESRHVWQHNLVKALDEGKITDPQLKSFAKKLKESPIINPEVDLKGYKESFHEKDAYSVGNKVAGAYWPVVSKEKKIFHNGGNFFE